LKTQSNLHVIENVLNWLEQGRAVWLYSITKTWGSSPMPAGTLMAYCSGRGVVGSLSGGCIEEDLIEKMETSSLSAGEGTASLPMELIYGKSEEEQQRFLLPCGGQLHLLVEYLRPQKSSIEHFTQLKQMLAKRQLVARRVSLVDGYLSVGITKIKLGIRRLDGRNGERKGNGKGVCIEHGMGPAYQMLLIGASEVARCVAELAQPLDFKVSVWDHRDEFTRNWHVDNVEVFKGSPEKLIGQFFSDANNAIIALAHDPRVDDIALVDDLATEAFYIGAIGSKKTCDNRNQRLLNYIDDASCLDKMHSPVGISIGSKTPYEIAISILAEVILQRSQFEKSMK